MHENLPMCQLHDFRLRSERTIKVKGMTCITMIRCTPGFRSGSSLQPPSFRFYYVV